MTATHRRQPEQPPGETHGGALLGTAFLNAFLSTAHISEYDGAERRPQKWKIGRQGKNPLKQRFKVNFQECFGKECLLEFDKSTVYNGRLLF